MCTLHLSRIRQRRTIGSFANENQRLTATKKWVETVVIGEKLCPFAPPVLHHETLRIVVSDAENAEEAVSLVAAEAHLLVGNGWDLSKGIKSETTLVVFDAPFVKDFRDFVNLSWTLQTDAVLANGHAEKLQLVLFHPHATHETYSSQDDSPGDYTIRSPFPTVHLLREQDVMRAVSYPNLESLPARNKARLVSQGLHVCKARLERCYQNVDPIR
jgi:hypothetical protein